MLPVGSPDYFEKRGTPRHPADLADHACIQSRCFDTGRMQPWNLRRASGEPAPSVPTSLICNTLEARLSFALDGFGIAYLPEFSVRDTLARGTLVAVLDDYASEVGTFRLMWPSSKYLAPKLRVLVDFLCKRIRDENRS